MKEKFDIKTGTQDSVLSYISNIIRDPEVASIAPTSVFGIKRIFSGIDLSRCGLFIEFGPGGGVITKYVLSQLPVNSRLVAIENNPDFARALAEEIKDERLIVIEGSAADVVFHIEKLYSEQLIESNRADYIVSGIPFSMFPPTLKDTILKGTLSVLSDNGAFLVYQFLISLSIGQQDIKNKLLEYFSITRSNIEMRNIPPLRIFEAKKR
ncbi:MAG TPA: rRNA adenine N-6-methyltransferase family protein [Oligoflexia bacterium]|nr:rRNA adenine N-6-methyltransferase family protein [Oligoflexia bacterium]HMP47702.1 rRNA adenine N-6-methyltransferase family protein [Oligoflexia bacterium]